MLQWEIDGEVRWLCTECTRENAHVFLLRNARFLGEERDSAQVCHSCRCGDHTVYRYGGWRWFYYAFQCLVGVMPALMRVKVLRRSR